MNVFYLSLALVTVLPVTLCSDKLQRRGNIALWTMWVFFLFVLFTHVALFLWANLEYLLD